MSYMERYTPKLGYPGPAGYPDKAWAAANLVSVELPWPMLNAYTGKLVTKVAFHRKGAAALVAALKAVWAKAEAQVRAGRRWQAERLRLKQQHGFNFPSSYYDGLMTDYTRAETLAMLDQVGGRVWGGSYVHRAVRGGSELSAHAWGAAVDVDPSNNPMGRPLRNKLPLWYVACWEAHGFRWGGSWSRPDPMHFELDEAKL